MDAEIVGPHPQELIVQQQRENKKLKYKYT